MGKPKSRNFTFLVYPDSAPEDWQSRLRDMGIPMAISPLHDQDHKEDDDRGTRRTAEDQAMHRAKLMADDMRNAVDDYDAYVKRLYDKYLTEIKGQADSQFKKPHWHVIGIWASPVTVDAVRNKLKRALGDQAIATVQIIATSVKNAYLYLTHESESAIEKHKHIYDKRDIVLLNNFDVDRYTVLDQAEKMDLFVNLINVVDEQNIMNMKQLMQYVKEHGAEIGIDSLRDLVKVTSVNMSYLKALFDGNFQTVYKRRWDKYLPMEDDNETGTGR